MPLRDSDFPPLAVYNLNHLGLSDPDRRSAKLALVRSLIQSHSIVGLQELHAGTELDANLYFFDHIDAKRFYDESLNTVIL